jgi:TolB-like protein
LDYSLPAATLQVTKQSAGGSAKSIAVLPFENLSADEQNTYFADGVQDQILTNLAKVSDLKVTSHTSARQYKSGMERNLREIGHQLGVAYIVEGSVQRAGNRLRINAQLIDARTDSHIWAETYDRTAADLFAIQSELAESIVAQLKAKLSPKQKAEIEERPTQDLVAFNLYLQAKQIVDSYLIAEDVRAALLKALQSLDEAIKRDEKFVAAYCYAARAKRSTLLFRSRSDPDRILLAETAVNAALRLRPDSAEAHFAMAIFCSDADATTIARWKNSQSHAPVCRIAHPSSFSPATSIGAVTIGLRLSEIFPRRSPSIRGNPNAYNLLADTYVLQRRFPEVVQTYDVSWMQVSRRLSFSSGKRRLFSLEPGIQNHCAKSWAKSPDMDVAGGQTPVRVMFALLDGNYARSRTGTLPPSPRPDFQDIDFSFYYPKAWFEAIVAQERGDSAEALNALRSNPRDSGANA